MLLVVVGATLRYWSRMPGLAMGDAATSRHRSKMPRWLGEKIWCWSNTKSGLNRFGTEENSKEFSQEQRKISESSVLCSAGLGEHERRSREVDLCL
ncbi:hypothetical protein B296_00051805 [Ensete ventricosum]|uniref:Uncharacterized protein n=1 Tax=Ensete ventricosum TaxID=4639 RepID=A0A426WZP8_ENSVE|nr:hypothetical protein B296_00051805 [Ensete ventricosum]